MLRVLVDEGIPDPMNRYSYAAPPASGLSSTTKTWIIVLLVEAVTATLLLLGLIGKKFLESRRAPIAWYSRQANEDENLERKTMVETPN